MLSHQRRIVSTEGRGVVVDAEPHPALVGGDVVDAVGHDLAEPLVLEIVDADRLRCALRPQLAAAGLEVADELLLLRVDRDRRLAVGLMAQDQPVDGLELLVAVRMHAALPRLAVRLQAEPQPVEQPRNGPLARLVPAIRELAREPPLAAADPAQRRFRIAADGALDQAFERRDDPGLRRLDGSASAARPADAARKGFGAGLKVGEATAEGAAGDPGDRSHRSDATPARRLRLGCGDNAPPALVQERRHSMKTEPDRFKSYHPTEMEEPPPLQRSVSSSSGP